MRIQSIRSFSFAALALLALAGSGVAQNTAPALLNAPEVQRLIARGTPGDHARLGAHFTALAAQDEAEAKRHATMEMLYRGNPKIGGVTMSAHCRRLADLGRASAAASRDLAAEHGKLAAGAAPTPTPSSQQSMAGARTPTEKELTDLASSAATAADHRTLEQYFTTLATRYDREAADHTAYAKSWRSSSKAANAATMASHCDRIAAQRLEAAKEARAAASMHKEQGAAAK